MNQGTDLPTFKILLIGDSGTGKSSLLLRFTDDQFLAEEMSATIGVDFKVKYLPIPKSYTIPSKHQNENDIDDEDEAETSTKTGGAQQKMKLTIWDTAGQERFRTLTSSYYRGCQGVILVYDITNRESFENIQKVWVPELGTYTSHQNPAVKMVVGNKVDLGDASESGGRVVSKEEGRMLARECGALFLECSAKTRIGVQQAFEELCLKILDTPELYQKQPPGSQSTGRNNANTVRLNASDTDEYEGGPCAC